MTGSQAPPTLRLGPGGPTLSPASPACWDQTPHPLGRARGSLWVQRSGSREEVVPLPCLQISRPMGSPMGQMTQHHGPQAWSWAPLQYTIDQGASLWWFYLLHNPPINCLIITLHLWCYKLIAQFTNSLWDNHSAPVAVYIYCTSHQLHLFTNCVTGTLHLGPSTFITQVTNDTYSPMAW